MPNFCNDFFYIIIVYSIFDQNIKVFKLRCQIFTGGQIFVGNGFCDDGLNTAECNFDGGDCCSPRSNYDYCSICQCNGTTPSGNTGLFSFQ